MLEKTPDARSFFLPILQEKGRRGFPATLLSTPEPALLWRFWAWTPIDGVPRCWGGCRHLVDSMMQGYEDERTPNITIDSSIQGTAVLPFVDFLGPNRCGLAFFTFFFLLFSLHANLPMYAPPADTMAQDCSRLMCSRDHHPFSRLKSPPRQCGFY